MLERVKKAIRISHDHLDDEILETIDAARAEMVRAGVSEDAAYSETLELVNKFILTYCQAEYASDKAMADKFEISWKYQLDNLRKTVGYMAEVVVDV